MNWPVNRVGPKKWVCRQQEGVGHASLASHRFRVLDVCWLERIRCGKERVVRTRLMGWPFSIPSVLGDSSVPISKCDLHLYPIQ